MKIKCDECKGKGETFFRIDHFTVPISTIMKECENCHGNLDAMKR